MEGHRDLHATIDTHYIHYIPPPPTIYTTLAGYGIAERDGERRESGRRACLRYGAERDLYAIRCGPGRRANGRDGVRYGAATIGACERCGLEPRASVTERALRALLNEFPASARPAATRTSTADYV